VPVTQLQYHPTRNNILLSGSTDGLVNIYDTTITDEDEALVQVINHGSIHHAGFLSENAIFALSHDELFSVHPATNPDDAAQEPEPVQFGDLRDPLGCEYVAQLCLGAQGQYIAAGNKMYVCCGVWNGCLLMITGRIGLILSHLFLVILGRWIVKTCGACLVLMVRRLCARFIWMNRYVRIIGLFHTMLEELMAFYSLSFARILI
jgi:hypothetical protein